MKRYNFETKNSKELRLIEHDSGNYITYKDAQDLIAELVALKKDARGLAELTMKDGGYIQRRSAARRILEATKKGE